MYEECGGVGFLALGWGLNGSLFFVGCYFVKQSCLLRSFRLDTSDACNISFDRVVLDKNLPSITKIFPPSPQPNLLLTPQITHISRDLT